MFGLDKTETDKDSILWSHKIPGTEPRRNSEMKGKMSATETEKLLLLKLHATHDRFRKKEKIPGLNPLYEGMMDLNVEPPHWFLI